MTVGQYDVFLTYARADERLARTLTDELISHDLRVFQDFDVIHAGDDWQTAIGRVLQEATAIVAVVSDNSVNSLWVEAELRSAEARARSGRALLIPVLTGSSFRIPPALEKFASIRAEDDRALAAAAEKIAQAVKEFAPGPPASLFEGVPDTPSAYIDNGQTERLVAAMNSPRANQSPIIQVLGPPGAGKSTLVAEACRRAREQFSYVWYIRPSSRDDAMSSLASLAVRLGLKTSTTKLEELADMALTSLERAGRRWLIVFDDAQAEYDLTRWLRHSSSTTTGVMVFIARQDLPWLNTATTSTINVERMSLATSVEFLQRSLNTAARARTELDDLRELAGFASGLPLALSLIAIRLNTSAETGRSLVQEFGSSTTFGQATSVRDVLQTSLASVASSSQAAAAIVRVLPWLGDSPFPVAGITVSAGDQFLPYGQVEILDGLDLLANAQIIDRDGSNFTAHDLVKSALTPGEPQAAAFLSRAISQYASSDAPTSLQELHWLADHILVLLRAATTMDAEARLNLLAVAQLLGRRLVQAQSASLASEVLAEALTISRETYGYDHPYTIALLTNLAAAYRDQGRTEEAAALLEQALTIGQEVLGPNHPSILTARANLASTFIDLGRYMEALTLLEQTLTASEEVLGRDHPSTLTTRATIASVYRLLGRPIDSLAFLEQTLTGQNRVLGPDHPSTLTTRANIASALRDAGRLPEAEEALEQVLEDSDRVLGSSDALTATVRANLELIKRERQLPESVQ